MNYEKIKKKYEEGKLNVGDIVSIPYKSENIDFMVLGININPNTDGSTDGKTYIDLMSTKCILDNVVWDKKDMSGNFSRIPSYINSTIINTINKEIDNIDKDISNHIIDRVIKILTGIRTDFQVFKVVSVTYKITNIGKIWLPSIRELDNIHSGYRSRDFRGEKQYPIFKRENISNIRLDKDYWTRSCNFGNDQNAYYAQSKGKNVNFCIGSINYECAVPLCFRLEI